MISQFLKLMHVVQGAPIGDWYLEVTELEQPPDLGMGRSSNWE